MHQYKFLLISILAIILILLIIDGIRIFGLLKISKNVIEKSIKFERINSNATKKIIVIGDSTAYGTGSRDPMHTTAGYLGALYKDAEIKNYGVIGQKIKDLNKEIQNYNIKYADLLLIHVGGNDILQFTPISEIEKSLYELLEKVKDSSKKIAILHTGNIGNSPFFPRYLGWIMTKRARAVREIYMLAAEKYKIAYVDLFQTRKDDVFNKNVDTFYAADLIHPADLGYKYWFQKILEALEKTYGTTEI